jgi:hypothetical protein
MWIALLGALLAGLLSPAPRATVQSAAPCAAVQIPVFPGGRVAGASDRGGYVGPGHTYVVTDESLLWVQQFYYNRLTSEGWAPVTPLPGQHPQSFAGENFIPNGVPEPVLEFTRANDTQFVRIVGEGGGYTIIFLCRD